MSVTAHKFLMKDSAFSVGGTDYTNQVWRVRLVPEQNIQTQRTLVPDGTAQDVDSPSYTLELTGFQSPTASASGLSNYLRENAGESVTFVITPKTGGISASGTFIALAPQFGGTQGEWAALELECPVEGEPTFY